MGGILSLALVKEEEEDEEEKRIRTKDGVLYFWLRFLVVLYRYREERMHKQISKEGKNRNKRESRRTSGVE